MAVHEVYPYLHVNDAAKAIAFYSDAFGAKEKFRLTEPSGRIGHAELDFNGYTLMLADEFPEYDIRGPQPGSNTTVTIHLHVDDCDAMIERAREAGAKVTMVPQDQFYGERSGVLVDPFGHRWNIGHSIEDVSTEEMQRRYSALLKEG
jgi:uncharacterized glyoxalase superfamily protein PhnB